MSYDAALAIYEALLWLIYGAGVPVAIYAIWHRSGALLRCSGVFLANETILALAHEFWGMNHWFFVLAINVIAMMVVMRRPAGFGQLSIGTTFMVAALCKLMFAFTDGGYGAYMVAWMNGIMITVLQAFALLFWVGGSNGRGRRIIDLVRSRLVHRSRKEYRL